MNTENIVEIVGYIGSALVLLSFLMTSVVRLRIVNMIGSAISFTYAMIIHSYPLALMNIALVLINLYFLWKAGHVERGYTLLPVAEQDPVVNHILSRYQEDIQKCFPGLVLPGREADRCYLILCEDVPAGLTLGRQADETYELFLDYSLPAYRDYSIGKFLKQALPGEGIRELRYQGPTENHLAYLEKMDFRQEEGGVWICRL
ncbi:MAG: hypothetical protein II882_05285 [Lachnospiraceae bacterium]|nr:hypothetical protein [Lachnospiraceae bacterium]